MNRVKERYLRDVVPALMKEFGYTNIMAVPKVTKIVINMGIGEATQNAKIAEYKQVTAQQLGLALELGHHEGADVVGGDFLLGPILQHALDLVDPLEERLEEEVQAVARQAAETVHRIPGQIDGVEFDMGNGVHERHPTRFAAEPPPGPAACGSAASS